MPNHSADKNTLAQLLVSHSEVSKRIQSTMYFILIIILYFILVLSVSDKTMMENNWLIKLPIFGTDISKPRFLVIGPIVLYLLSLYLQAFIKHKQQVEDNIKKVSNRSFNALIKHPAIFNLDQKLSGIASLFFQYWFIPVVVLCFLFDSIDEANSYYYVSIVFSLCICTSIHKWNIVKTIIRKKKSHNFIILLGFIILIHILFFIREFIGESEYKHDLTFANLAGANLYGKNLSKINLEGANLKGANVSYAVLDKSNLNNTKLDEANFRLAKLRKVNMSYSFAHKANFYKADFDTGSVLINTQFHGSLMNGAGLRGANLKAAGLRVTLSWAILVDANLVSADAVGAKLVGTYLNRANMHDISLDRAVLIGATAINTDLSGAKLHRALLHGCNLKDANLSGANLSYAQLQDIDSDKFPWSLYNYGSTDDNYTFPIVQFHGPTKPANVENCNFKNTILDSTIVYGVDFSNAINLTVDQLIMAKGDRTTKLPDNLDKKLIYKSWENY